MGDTGPGGGKVFYVASGNFTSTGSDCVAACKYLEAAPSDHSSTVAWGCSGAKTGATATAIGTGKANTATILTNCTTAGIAADVANKYSTTNTAGAPGAAGQWFLPSKDELNELCKYARTQATGNTSVICNSAGSLRGGFAAGYYWSSSEDDAYYARVQYFYGGNQGYSSKFVISYVRPVRAF